MVEINIYFRSISTMIRVGMHKWMKFSSLKEKIPSEHQKIFEICRPEFKKYAKNGIVTMIHAGLFMYLPTIYADISHLMELKVSVVGSDALWWEYGTKMGKWTLYFATLGFLTYWRRF